MDSALLPDDLTAWRLLLRISSGAIHAVAYRPGADNSLVAERIPLDPAAESTVRAVEDAVYSNPFLLRDFGRITVVIVSAHRLFVPTEELTEELAESLIARILPAETDPDSLQVMTAQLTPLRGVVEAFSIPREIAGFLRRTFFNVAIREHLEPLCRFLVMTQGRHGVNRMAVNVNSDEQTIDLIAFNGNRLLLANTFAFTRTDDAVYYILAARQTLGLTEADILICGTGDERAPLSACLAEFVPQVLPIIFPSEMYMAGKDAMTVPFDLIITPLCE